MGRLIKRAGENKVAHVKGGGRFAGVLVDCTSGTIRKEGGKRPSQKKSDHGCEGDSERGG